MLCRCCHLELRLLGFGRGCATLPLELGRLRLELLDLAAHLRGVLAHDAQVVAQPFDMTRFLIERTLARRKLRGSIR